MEEQLVSIVIPTFNCAHFLSRALQSVLDQTYTNWEALVIDNHSLDNTDEVLRGFQDGRIRVFKINNDGVIAASRNLGIREAKGRWIAFLDADDWWVPEKLEASVATLCDGCDLVYHDLIHVAERPRLFSRRSIRTWDLRPPVADHLIAHGNALTNSSVVVRRDLLVEIDGLSENPRLVGAEDFDCWVRLARRTDRFARLPKAYGYYWTGAGNTSSAARIIVCLGELRECRLSAAANPSQDCSPAWISFALGKAHFQLRQYDRAIEELSRITLDHGPWHVLLKVLLMKLFVRATAAIRIR